MSQKFKNGKKRIISFKIDENSFYTELAEVKQERNIAIYDLLDDNFFEIVDKDFKHILGPYNILTSFIDGKVLFQIFGKEKKLKFDFYFSLLPLHKVLRDYEIIYMNYFEAVKNLPPNKIEAIDVGRRSLHNEGGIIIKEKFSENIKINLKTGRRIFTLLFSLHIDGEKFW